MFSITDSARFLPLEVTEKILTVYVDSFDVDPAYQWNKLRNLSAYQRARIERTFRRRWLPNLSVTLYVSPWEYYDFVHPQALEKAEVPCYRSEAEGIVELKIDRSLARNKPRNNRNSENDNISRQSFEFASVIETWRQQSFTSRAAYLRFGEGMMNRGAIGSYIIHDVYVTDLAFGDDGGSIMFNWRDAITTLMREEMFMRQAGNRLFEESCNLWGDMQPPQNRFDTIPLDKQLEFWVNDVQMQRRVKLLEHRLKWYDRTGLTKHKYSWHSRNLHGRSVETPARPGAYSSICSRKEGPDIFEVVAHEEYMVASTNIFRAWAAGKNYIHAMILKLYEQAFSLQSHRFRAPGDHEDWRERRIEWWKANHHTIDSIRIEHPTRWDPLL